VLHQADDVDPPGLLLFRLEANALERDPDFYLVAVVGHPALGVEDVVRAEVGPLPFDHRVVEAVATGGAGLHQRTIGLHPEGVDREDAGLASVVEGAEEDLDVVVRFDPVAIGERCMHGAVRLEGPDTEVNGGGGVPDQHLGGINRRHSIGG
jgi:hypothetical protein